MMHPAAHLSHMGSMVTNAGTYVGVPEHRFMYQGGMGFFHAGEHGGNDGGIVDAGHMGFNAGHGGEMEAAHGGEPMMAQSRDQTAGAVEQGAPGGELAAGSESAQPIEQQEFAQGAPMEPAGGEEQAEAGFGGQQVAGFGGQQEAAFGGQQEFAAPEQGMIAKSKNAKESKISKRKFINRLSKVRNTIRRSKRQETVDPYAYRHSDVPMYDYAPYPKVPRHHKTEVNVDVVGKRSVDDNNNNNENHFLF